LIVKGTKLKIIGIDLGGEYGKGSTGICECEFNDKLIIKRLFKEEELFKEYKSNNKNDNLKKYLESFDNALICIDAPFSIPARIKGLSEPLYKIGKSQLDDPYIYDNSARFIYKITSLKVLAPAASWIGSLTARMIKLQDNTKINFIKTQVLRIKGLNAIEVYPAATLKVLSLNINYKKDFSKKGKIIKTVSKYVSNLDDFQIKDSHILDSIICALSGFLVLKGYYKEEKNVFKNSFIFVPKLS
jgi:predicted nuclease with RNAse H fold